MASCYETVELQDHYYAMQSDFGQAVPLSPADLDPTPQHDVYYVRSEDAVANLKVRSTS